MSKSKPSHITPGVLSKKQIETLMSEGCISSTQFGNPSIGGSAVDLNLGSEAWKLKLGQRPTTRELSKIQQLSSKIDPVKNYFEFEKGGIYLVQLDQYLKLPSNISGRATGKSTVGRLDVITRLITNQSPEYDLVAAGYDGPLYLLLMPQTFTIKVAAGASVNQLRFFSGAHCSSIITRDQLNYYGSQFWWTLQDGTNDEYENFPITDQILPTDDPLLFDLTVDLGDTKLDYIYKAKPDVSAVIDIAKKGAHPPEEFFEKVNIEHEVPDRFVILEQGSFYIMKSRERLYIPHDVAVEVVAISERIGDIRIHYAGFAHPGFGRSVKNSKATCQPSRKGTPLIFEVRASDMRTKLYHKSILARIQLFRMSEKTESDSSDYEEQELKLSKVFADWSKEEQ